MTTFYYIIRNITITSYPTAHPAMFNSKNVSQLDLLYSFTKAVITMQRQWSVYQGIKCFVE